MAPEYLYKYRRWDDQHPYDKKILTESIIYFASAKSFNDPFDCSVPFNFKISDDQALERIKGLIKKNNPFLPSQDVKRQAKSWQKKGYYKDPNNLRTLCEQDLERRFTTGILSLSETCNDILMWSHYSAAHTGFCVGLDKNALDKYRDDIHGTTRKLVDSRKVIYQDAYPDFNFFEMNAEESFILPLITKSAHWAYEQEHRCLLYDDYDKEIPLKPGIIRKIIFGCRMRPETQNEIRAILNGKQSGVSFFNAIPKENSFGLDIAPIE